MDPDAVRRIIQGDTHTLERVAKEYEEYIQLMARCGVKHVTIFI
jgi:hypothetical protein